MGTWRVPADVMANGRFAITAMAEVVGALGALTRPRTPDQRAFREAHGAAFADWVASRPGAADLVAASFRDARPGVAGWMADDPSMPPETEDATFDEGLEVVRRLSDADVRADLRETTQAPSRADPDDARRARGRAGPRGLAVDPHAADRLGSSRADPARRHRLAHRPARPARLGHGAAGPRPRPRVGRRRAAAHQPLRPAHPHPRGGQPAALRAHADPTRRSSVGRTPTATPSTTPWPVGWPGSTPPTAPDWARWSARTGPRYWCCSTSRATPPSSPPSPARRSGRSADTSRCCSRPARAARRSGPEVLHWRTALGDALVAAGG